MPIWDWIWQIPRTNFLLELMIPKALTHGSLNPWVVNWPTVWYYRSLHSISSHVLPTFCDRSATPDRGRIQCWRLPLANALRATTVFQPISERAVLARWSTTVYGRSIKQRVFIMMNIVRVVTDHSSTGHYVRIIMTNHMDFRNPT